MCTHVPFGYTNVVYATRAKNKFNLIGPVSVLLKYHSQFEASGLGPYGKLTDRQLWQLDVKLKQCNKEHHMMSKYHTTLVQVSNLDLSEIFIIQIRIEMYEASIELR